jgi:hypothetical protein
MEKLNPPSNNTGKRELLLTIEGNQYQWSSQYITGTQIKQLAGIPLDVEVYLSIKEPWEDELIPNDENVNLARPSIEHFFVKQKLKITINQKPYNWYSQYITGKQIRDLGQIDSDDEIFLEIKEPYKNELISDETVVDLARPTVEHFISKEKPPKFNIIVNGREKVWVEKDISFEQVVMLSFGNYVDNASTIYTIVYKRGIESKPEGTMVKGDVINVKNKMIFNVSATDKS